MSIIVKNVQLPVIASATSAALAATQDAAFTDGQLSYVATYGDYFSWHPGQSLTPVAGVVINGPTGQWTRMGIPNRTFLAAQFWSIDPVSGNDEAQGWGASTAASDLVPLKTMAELDRRLAGNPGYTGAPFFHILNNVPSADSRVMQNIKSKSGSTSVFPIIAGALSAPLTTGTVTNYTAAVPAANTGFLVDLTSAATYIGKCLIDQDNRYAWVLDAASANVAVISQPMAEVFGPVIGCFPPEPRDLVNGKTFGVYTFPTLPFWPFNAECMYGTVAQLDIAGGVISENLGGTQPFILKCILRGGSPAGNGTGGAWTQGAADISGCLFTKSGSNTAWTSRGGQHVIHSCTVLNGFLYILNGASCSFQETLTLYNSTVKLDETASVQGVRITTPRLQIGIFNTTTPAFTGGSVRFPSDGGTVYGAGNGSTIFEVPQGRGWSIPKAGSTATTSGSQITVGGTAKTWADVPFVNTANNASISDGY
jgi:hypothetical protein